MPSRPACRVRKTVRGKVPSLTVLELADEVID
jgi:hypothetical protein